jgi:saccharopine dehydrogenase (NADP+, L-glutamate forming)/spermidine synthase
VDSVIALVGAGLEPGAGTFQAYTNRDCLGYIELYGLEGITTMFRGTLRYPGWCEAMKKIVDLGLLDDTSKDWPAGTTLADYTRSFVKNPDTDNLKKDVAAFLALSENSDPLQRFEWLGLLSNNAIPIESGSSLDVLAAVMLDKMPYKPGERDMVVMRHEFVADYPSRLPEKICSTMVDYGIPNGDSSMSRTVGLPTAIATKLILQGAIQMTGVHIPVDPRIYEPVLAELESVDIRFTERTEKL